MHRRNNGVEGILSQDEIRYSLVIPVYKNERNMPDLLLVLETLALRWGAAFEVVFVVDGSPDASAEILKIRLPLVNFNSQLLCLSRNFGAFPAIRMGLQAASGRFIAIMAADLQEPPELVTTFFECLQNDTADIAIGQRVKRNDRWWVSKTSELYWTFYRKFILPDIPKGGVDIFACNRLVCDSLLQIQEPNSSLIAQLFWVGYRRTFVPYERKERAIGKSSWTLRKKFRYMLDSIFSYSDLPIMLIFWVGFLGVLISFLAAIVVLVGWFLGAIAIKGYTPVMLAVSFLTCGLLMSQGLMGCYLWRTFENSKHRPAALINFKKTFRRNKKDAEEA